MTFINSKLVRISLASVTATALIITSLFIFFSNRALRNEAYRKLDEDARNIEELFTKGESIDSIRRSLTLGQLLFSDPMLTDRLVLIDDNRNYLPFYDKEALNELNRRIADMISDEIEQQRKYITFSIDGKENVGIAYRVRIATFTSAYTGNIRIGWLFLYVPFDEIKVDDVVLKVFFASLALSMMTGTAITIYFSRRITKPLKQLSVYSKMISERRFEEVKQIRTGDEFERLSSDIVNMAEKLRKYDNRQKEFFQNTSHNLKTPLMSIRGYAESILDGVAADNEKALNVIIDETDRLTELIKEILFISKSESVDEFYRFYKYDIRDILEEVYQKVSAITNESGIELIMDADDDLFVSADKDKLINALMNILSNSVRYAENEICIKAYKDSCEAVIKIEDDGKGFLPGEEDMIFERFYKGEKGNFGLGLYIARMIINKHAGTISAYSGKKGACFEIRLKVNENVSDEIHTDI